MKIWPIMLIVLFWIVNCNALSKKINMEGNFGMNGDISPIILSYKHPIGAILNANDKDKFYLVSDGIYVAHLHGEKINRDKIDSVNFGMPCKEYYSDAATGFLYAFGVRDFHIINLKEKKSRKIVVSHDPNEFILSALVSNRKESTFLIDVNHTGFSDEQSYEYFLTYDFNKDSVIDKREKCQYGGIVYYINDSELLFEKWNGPNLKQWWITNANLKSLSSNRLTEKLSSLNFYALESNIDYQNMKMIGTIRDGKMNDSTFSIFWDESFKNITITPFTFQEPKDRSLGTEFQFSSDGKWVRNCSDSGSPDNNTQIVFYNADKKYPGGLSLPVNGMIKRGDAYFSAGGIFLDTPEYGTVYLDISDGLEGIIYMYKMSDVMSQIVKKAAEMK